MTNKVKVRTIIFTEACPLACRYCDLKNDSSFGKRSWMTKEEVLSLVDKFDKQDNPEEVNTRILFSGGEPFLYWDWIKEIIDKYQHRFQYEFNTCGYLFTEEILEYLSHYDVSFVLSVDGNEKLTNYLRPLRSSPYKVGYFKKLKEIIPTLLFYFPTTPYRIIINPRYVDLLHEMYLEAVNLGFKYFTYIIDFESRPGRTIPKDKQMVYWTEEHTEILAQQIDLILTDIITGFIEGKAYPQSIEINKAFNFILNEKPYVPENIPCALFDNRTLTTIYDSDDEDKNCMTGIPEFQNLNNLKEALATAYQQQNHQCMKDPKCPAFEYCAFTCCPQLSYTQRSGFFDFDELECVVNKVSYQAAIKLLSVCNELCPDSSLYRNYLNTFNYDGKEEAIKWQHTTLHV